MLADPAAVEPLALPDKVAAPLAAPAVSGMLLPAHPLDRRETKPAPLPPPEPATITVDAEAQRQAAWWAEYDRRMGDDD
jgi:predicted component of type VI protein secretion system